MGHEAKEAALRHWVEIYGNDEGFEDWWAEEEAKRSNLPDDTD